MSDTVGHDGPSGAGDDGPVVITVNGRRMWVADNVTVALLLESLGYPARGVAVALNRAVLPRSAWQTKLSDGARLEVLTAVQVGGVQVHDRGPGVHLAADHGTGGANESRGARRHWSRRAPS